VPTGVDRSKLGEQIALGSRSVVHAWGVDAVAKVPLPLTPEGWIRFEAGYTDAVYQCGAPVPRVLGIEVIDGREVSIFERIDGVSMWDALMQRESNARAFGRELGETHARLLALTPPITLPSQHTRLTSKITTAAHQIDSTLSRVLAVLPPSSVRPSLCHGDFHPKNIMLSAKGPIVVDWFDASRGERVGDVARTSLLLSAQRHNNVQPKHLPGASRSVLDELHDSYLATVRTFVPVSNADLETWRFVQAAARLAEGVERQPLLDVLAGLSAYTGLLDE
jgi:aminoglycoside phosphotransferase (APT) family kinase protein